MCSREREGERKGRATPNWLLLLFLKLFSIDLALWPEREEGKEKKERRRRSVSVLRESEQLLGFRKGS